MKFFSILEEKLGSSTQQPCYILFLTLKVGHLQLGLQWTQLHDHQLAGSFFDEQITLMLLSAIYGKKNTQESIML